MATICYFLGLSLRILFENNSFWWPVISHFHSLLQTWKMLKVHRWELIAFWSHQEVPGSLFCNTFSMTELQAAALDSFRREGSSCVEPLSLGAGLARCSLPLTCSSVCVRRCSPTQRCPHGPGASGQFSQGERLGAVYRRSCVLAKPELKWSRLLVLGLLCSEEGQRHRQGMWFWAV